MSEVPVKTTVQMQLSVVILFGLFCAGMLYIFIKGEQTFQKAQQDMVSGFVNRIRDRNIPWQANGTGTTVVPPSEEVREQEAQQAEETP
jgi:hypothetical protein